MHPIKSQKNSITNRVRNVLFRTYDDSHLLEDNLLECFRRFGGTRGALGQLDDATFLLLSHLIVPRDENFKEGIAEQNIARASNQMIIEIDENEEKCAEIDRLLQSNYSLFTKAVNLAAIFGIIEAKTPKQKRSSSSSSSTQEDIEEEMLQMLRALSPDDLNSDDKNTSDLKRRRLSSSDSSYTTSNSNSNSNEPEEDVEIAQLMDQSDRNPTPSYLQTIPSCSPTPSDDGLSKNLRVTPKSKGGKNG